MKETLGDKLAREKAERDKQNALYCAWLPVVLLKLVARATALGVSTTVSEPEGDPLEVAFLFECRDYESGYDPVTVNLKSAKYLVDNVARELGILEEKQNAERAKLALRNEVLARLTEAERDALGV